jgi:hypothetical protein
MLLILKFFPPREPRQNPLCSKHPSPSRRLGVTKDHDPVTSDTGSAASKAEHNPRRANRDRAATEGKLQVERLGTSKIEAEKVKAQRSERSRQLVENKDQAFSHGLESRQLVENMGSYFCKAVNILKSQAISLERTL